MLLIGSRALAHHLGNDFWREPKDYDYIAYKEDAEKLLGISIEDGALHASNYVNDVLHECWIADYSPALQGFLSLEMNKGKGIASLWTCFQIKAAHRYFYRGNYKKSFKHLDDYSRLKEYLFKTTGWVHGDASLALLWRDELIKEYDDIRLTKVPKLNKSKEEFFNDKVVYHEVHDLVHGVVAYGSRPAYELCLGDNEVMFDVKKFEALPFEIKMQMVCEEAMVIHWERCLSPLLHGRTDVPAYTPIEAFKYAITRIATNLTSGKFREFAADNFHVIFDYWLNTKSNIHELLIEKMEDIKSPA